MKRRLQLGLHVYLNYEFQRTTDFIQCTAEHCVLHTRLNLSIDKEHTGLLQAFCFPLETPNHFSIHRRVLICINRILLHCIQFINLSQIPLR